MNRDYIRPEDWGTNYDPPHPETHQLAAWGAIIVMLMFAMCVAFFSRSAHAQALPWLTASATKGISPMQTTLTWTAPAGSVSCVASSTGNQPVWTGSKPLSGSQLVTGMRASSDYKLDCVSAAGTTVTATLSWKLPTTNTDNSPYTNHAGSRVSWGTSAADVAANFDTHAVKLADPTALSYTFDKIPAGPLFYAVRIYTTAGIESALSDIVTKTGVATAAQTFSSSVHVTVDTQPAPPAITTIETTAYEINKTTNAIKLAAVGTVPLGVSCSPQYDANGLHVVPRERVKFKSATRPLVVVAKCG